MTNLAASFCVYQDTNFVAWEITQFCIFLSVPVRFCSSEELPEDRSEILTKQLILVLLAIHPFISLRRLKAYSFLKNKATFLLNVHFIERKAVVFFFPLEKNNHQFHKKMEERIKKSLRTALDLCWLWRCLAPHQKMCPVFNLLSVFWKRFREC